MMILEQILKRTVILSSCILSMFPLAFAQVPSVSFVHDEWEIYCANTGTCQAAGYNLEDGEQLPASILLTRKAGANQAVTAQVALSAFEQDLPDQKLNNIHLYLNGKDLGMVKFSELSLPLMGTLSALQTQALLQNAKQKNQIIFKNQYYSWQVSDQGMTAVLLKMDEVQRRLNTTGALIKPGHHNENNVLKAQPVLQIKKVETPTTAYKFLEAGSKDYQTIQRKLRASLPENVECAGGSNVYSDLPQAEPIELYKLSNQKILATSLCWRAAYNEGYGAWVLNENFSGAATFITDQMSDVLSGELYSSQKGRGLGDCWATASWVWNGKMFIQRLDRWSGMCKGLAAGGVWELDLIDAEIK